MTVAGVLGIEERTFLVAARTATLATTASNGRARLLPVCFAVATQAADSPVRLYSPLDDKPKQSEDPHELARVRDLLARPEATILVDRWSEDWTRLAWLRLEATTDLLEPGSIDRLEHDTAVTLLRAKYLQYATHRLETRPILGFTIERAVSWGNLGLS